MRRIVLLYLITLLSILFLLLQIVVYQHLFGKEEKQSVSISDGWFERKQDRRILDWFLEECYISSVPVTIVQPEILQSFLEQDGIQLMDDMDPECKILCFHGAVISFFVLASEWQTSLLDSMSTRGFTVSPHEEEDPRLTSLTGNVHQSLTTHYFIFHTLSPLRVIHIVMLFERRDYLWHTAVSWDDVILANGQEVDLTTQNLVARTAGVYKRLDTQTSYNGKLSFPADVKSFLKAVSEATFLECNYMRARLFHDKYGRDQSTDSLLFRDKVKQALIRTTEALDKIGVRFWMNSGTLLGWMRQCDTIAYSIDVDVGVWINDYDERIIETMSRYLPFKYLFGRINDSLTIAFGSDIKVDMFFFYEDEVCMWNGGTEYSDGEKIKYIFPKFTLCWTEFLELMVRIPCNTLAHVQANYGQKWFEPVYEWNWKYSPPNARKNGYWTKDERESVMRLAELLEGEDEEEKEEQIKHNPA